MLPDVVYALYNESMKYHVTIIRVTSVVKNFQKNIFV